MNPTSSDNNTPAASTRARILTVAERMFAEQGYNGVSLRAITAAANANMASVHYYFGTKQALLSAIFEARVHPLQDERRILLEKALNAASNKRPDVRSVLAAFIGPGVRLGKTPEGAVFNRLSAICSVDPDPVVRNIVFGVHDDIAQSFTAALRTACPELDGPAFFVRLQCVFGSMMYFRADNGRVDRLTDGKDVAAAHSDVDASLENLLDFLPAGMQAPTNKARKKS